MKCSTTKKTKPERPRRSYPYAKSAFQYRFSSDSDFARFRFDFKHESIVNFHEDVDIEKAFDEVAPVTHPIELQDEDGKDPEDLHPMGEDIFTQYDIANDLKCVERKILFYELTDIMRQKNHKIFAGTLNGIREGNQTFLKTGVIESDIPEYPTFATHLLYHNKSIDMYNNNLYSECKKQKVIVKCKDIVVGDISAKTKKKQRILRWDC
ncbi:unnamed protein product [Mytilus edulis]|uniref:Uncharacterized protein n=1 Tax=Mytilus edulis TaxID=6550 RepID=A0A8S3RE07_MYTED|nr:unnamed protein product [Mytilus edulis]